MLKKFRFKIVDKRLIIFLGIANGLGYLLQYVGMPYTTAAKAALFINLSAMWVAVLSPKLLGERISPPKAAGVLFGLVGIILVSTNLDFSALSQGQLAGDGLLLISGVAWALFMIYNKKLITNSTATTFQFMTWVLIFTLLTVVPFSLLSGSEFFALDGLAWAAIIYQAIFCWIVPYYLWLEGLKHLSASTSTILLLSEVVVAVIASLLFLQEPVTISSTIGALLIIVAILLVSVKTNHLARRD
jgi:drug/metabolite transporter (DMT)-like permease